MIFLAMRVVALSIGTLIARKLSPDRLLEHAVISTFSRLAVQVIQKIPTKSTTSNSRILFRVHCSVSDEANMFLYMEPLISQ